MSVLTKNEILKRLKKGEIKIEPLNEKNIGPGSIDLTLDNEFRMFNNKNKKIILDEKTDYKDYTEIKKGPVVLNPGEFILGITKEKIKLPPNLCGMLSGRSRFARMGIIVHATASFIQPGINNKQVLEIYNLSKKKIVLNPGLKICQLSILKCEGKALYKGRFAKQTNV
ncbi:dCTP deaminase [Candidatus Woesearchaeota archaeon]|nr:MAG: dCTP deaminase [Candidatus Woesearchaeota archaeon]